MMIWKFANLSHMEITQVVFPFLLLMPIIGIFFVFLSTKKEGAISVTILSTAFSIIGGLIMLALLATSQATQKQSIININIESISTVFKKVPVKMDNVFMLCAISVLYFFSPIIEAFGNFGNKERDESKGFFVIMLFSQFVASFSNIINNFLILSGCITISLLSNFATIRFYGGRFGRESSIWYGGLCLLVITSLGCATLFPTKQSTLILMAIVCLCAFMPTQSLSSLLTPSITAFIPISGIIMGTRLILSPQMAKLNSSVALTLIIICSIFSSIEAILSIFKKSGKLSINVLMICHCLILFVVTLCIYKSNPKACIQSVITSVILLQTTILCFTVLENSSFSQEFYEYKNILIANKSFFFLILFLLAGMCFMPVSNIFFPTKQALHWLLIQNKLAAYTFITSIILVVFSGMVMFAKILLSKHQFASFIAQNEKIKITVTAKTFLWSIVTVYIFTFVLTNIVQNNPHFFKQLLLNAF